MPGQKTRPRRWQARMRADASPSEQLSLAYDRLRSAAARLYRPRRDHVRQREASQLASSVLLRAAAVLTGMADEMERSETRRGDAA